MNYLSRTAHRNGPQLEFLNFSVGLEETLTIHKELESFGLISKVLNAFSFVWSLSVSHRLFILSL